MAYRRTNAPVVGVAAFLFLFFSSFASFASESSFFNKFEWHEVNDGTNVGWTVGAGVGAVLGPAVGNTRKVAAQCSKARAINRETLSTPVRQCRKIMKYAET